MSQLGWVAKQSMCWSAYQTRGRLRLSEHCRGLDAECQLAPDLPCDGAID